MSPPVTGDGTGERDSCHVMGSCEMDVRCSVERCLDAFGHERDVTVR